MFIKPSKLNLLSVAVLTTLLTACGGGGSGSSNPADDNQQNQKPVIKHVTLNDIVGVWKETRKVRTYEDIRYHVYKADGSYKLYDYVNDSMGNSKEFGGYYDVTECYDVQSTASVKELGKGKFEIGGSEKTLTLDGNLLTIKTVLSDTIEMTTIEKSDKKVEDFIPSCEEANKKPVKEEPKEPTVPDAPKKPEIPENTPEVAVTLDDLKDKVWYDLRQFSWAKNAKDVRYYVFNEKGEKIIYDYKNDEMASQFGGKPKECYDVFADEADFAFKAGKFFTKGKSLIIRGEDGSIQSQFYDIGKAKTDLMPTCS